MSLAATINRKGLLAGRPFSSINFPTEYAATRWEEFYADTFSIYKTNPSFLKTPEYQYLYDFFQQNFP